MRRFGRFIILAILGFALGGGLAYFQAMQEAKHLSAPAVISEVEPFTEPETSVAETSLSDAAVDVVAETGATTEIGASAEVVPDAAPQDTAVQQVQPENTVTQSVVGSSVGGAFSLTDHNGLAVTEKSWLGKYKLVFFGFTHCPDICPTTLGKLTDVLNTLGTDSEKLQTLFVTTDAGRDTADVMKTYIGGYHASILGLTGTEEQLKAMQDTYKVYAAKVPGADANTYSMDHSAYVFLMSPDDQMLEIFKMDDAATDVVLKIKTHLGAAAPVTP